jgi:hypothetical protein
MTDTELEALAERAASTAVSQVLMKLGCPDPDTDPAGATRWYADAQMGIRAVTTAREKVTKWVGNTLLFILAVGTTWLSLKTVSIIDPSWYSNFLKQ